jgi:hypothetical protein
MLPPGSSPRLRPRPAHDASVHCEYDLAMRIGAACIALLSAACARPGVAHRVLELGDTVGIATWREQRAGTDYALVCGRDCRTGTLFFTFVSRRCDEVKKSVAALRPGIPQHRAHAYRRYRFSE